MGENENIPEGMVLISKKEYNGLKNALRIVRDRAVQQIEKSVADQHGYKLLRAELRRYEYGSRDKAWLVTKATPYSCKIDYEKVRDLIAFDLDEYYNYHDIRGLVSKKSDMARAADAYFDRFIDKDFLMYNNDDGRELKRIFDECEGVIVFEVSKISCNYGTGVYEISYWATRTI